MLNVKGPTGKFEVSPETEAALAALTDNELCVMLNHSLKQLNSTSGSSAVGNCQFLRCELIAEAFNRQTVRFTDAYGYLPAS